MAGTWARIEDIWLEHGPGLKIYIYIIFELVIFQCYAPVYWHCTIKIPRWAPFAVGFFAWSETGSPRNKWPHNPWK